MIKLNRKLTSLMICLTGAHLGILPMASLPACADSSNNIPARRCLVFPKQFSLGKVYIYNPTDEKAGLLNANAVAAERGRFVGQAQGTLLVKLTKNSRLYFYPSYKLIDHPEALNELDPNTFDCLAFVTTPLLVSIDKTVAPLSHLTGLRRLEMEGAELSDANLTPLKSLINLESLSLVGNSIHGSCLKDLASLPRLRDLDLSMNPLSPQAYLEIARFKNLERISLCQCGVTDEALVHLAKLPKLQILAINQASITSKGLALLEQLKHLRHLSVTGTTLSVKDLSILKHTSLTTIDLPARTYTDAEMQILTRELPAVRLRRPNKARSVDNETKTIFAPLH